MHEQTEIQFVHKKENNEVSQKILDNNSIRFNGQCKNLLEHLICGKVIDCETARILYGIHYLPRRILDLEQKLGIRAVRRYATNGLATYFYTPEQIDKIKGKIK